jgi:pyridoxamine 5'-phosphate oxidase
MSNPNSIADIRREYTLAGLRRTNLEADAIAQFSKWFDQARAAEVPETNAMSLATSDKSGHPSGRIVLLKNVDAQGFTFFTNYGSRKGRELSENPNAWATFFWPQLERQVNIAGTVSKVSHEVSEQYFNSRPKGSRLAAWVSNQDEPIADRAVLEKKLEMLSAKHPGDAVPLPPYWGGYCLTPTRIEFWQGRPNRLHDRFQYLKQSEGGWLIERLSP